MSIEAKDKSGKPIEVGQVCIYLGDKFEDKDYPIGSAGDRVVVRAIFPAKPQFAKVRSERRRRPFGMTHIRVDDAIDKPDGELGFTWSAIVCEDQIVAV